MATPSSGVQIWKARDLEGDLKILERYTGAQKEPHIFNIPYLPDHHPGSGDAYLESKLYKEVSLSLIRALSLL